MNGLKLIIDHLKAIREEVVSVTDKLEAEEVARRERDIEAQERWDRIQANAEAAAERRRHEDWAARESREVGIPLRGDRW